MNEYLRFAAVMFLLMVVGCVDGDSGAAGADRPPEDSIPMNAPRTGGPGIEPMDTTGHSGRGTAARPGESRD